MNTPSSFNASRIVALCRALVRIASRLVPSDRRGEWRAEWEGELWALWHRADRGMGRYPHPRRALLGFSLGSFAHATAELRQEWNAEILGYELRHSLRSLANNRVFSLTAALLIALGVGANTTVFTLVNAVMLRAPRGIEAPDRLAQIGRGGSDPHDFDNWSYPQVNDFRTHNTVFTDLAAFETFETIIGRDDDAAAANAQLVSGNYFRVLGAVLARGRGFVDDDDAEGAAPVAVISDGTWRARLGGDPNILGKRMSIRGRDFEIVGVARPEFTGADVGRERPDVWVPLSSGLTVTGEQMLRLDSRRMSWLWIVGRLKPGVDAGDAQTAMRTLFRQMQLDRDGEVRDEIVVAGGLGLRPDARAVANVVSAALLAIVGAVLLIACANLAALLMARGTARATEIGVRLALGAGRRRIVRQLVMETIVIAVGGSVAAFALTHWTAKFVAWLMPYPLSVSIQPDLRVLAFALVLGVVTSALFGLMPAARSTRVDLLSLLRAGGVEATLDRGRVRAALLVGQIAISFVLLGATGLLMRTALRAGSTNPGFRTDDILVADIDLRGPTRSGPTAATRLEEIAKRAAAVPGVVGVALASHIPATGSMPRRTMWPADGDFDRRRMPVVNVMDVDTAYFHVMGVPILRGRQFDATLDPAGAPTAIVVNETFARRLWGGEEAIGKTVSLGAISGSRDATVVGIARDARSESLRSDPGPQAYFLIAQKSDGRALLHVRATTARAGAKLAAAVAAELRPLMLGAPTPRFVTVRDRLSRGIADVRLIGMLGAAFGALALLLAAGGIYGVVSYETARREREYGVRLALGASPARINAMVLRQTTRLGALGIGVGALVTAAVVPLLKHLIFGVSPFDPLTFVGVAATLCAVTVLGALAPAVRASRSDPMTSLRGQ
jgi:predicted permease